MNFLKRLPDPDPAKHQLTSRHRHSERSEEYGTITTKVLNGTCPEGQNMNKPRCQTGVGDYQVGYLENLQESVKNAHNLAIFKITE